MRIELPTRPHTLETDNYYLSSDGWHYAESGNPVTFKTAIKALDKWHAEAWKRANPSVSVPYPYGPRAVAVDKPKRKWEVAFTDRVYVLVEAHSFILSDTDIAFHVDGQLPAVFWAQTRNIYHVKEVS